MELRSYQQWLTEKAVGRNVCDHTYTTKVGSMLIRGEMQPSLKRDFNHLGTCSLEKGNLGTQTLRVCWPLVIALISCELIRGHYVFRSEIFILQNLHFQREAHSLCIIR